MRDRSTALQVLDFYGEGPVGAQRQLEIILGYIVSHNVRQIRINVEKIQHFPPCLFSRHNLTSLHISVAYPHRTLFPNSLNFPALTNLSLQSFDFSVDDDGRVEPFSAFNKLNSLIIKYCKVLDNQNLCISSATLAHLTINIAISSYILQICVPWFIRVILQSNNSAGARAISLLSNM
jgi:hypothetical protein